MATEEKGKAYEGGAGGKFRKRPYRNRTQTTPYDRPPTFPSNPNTNNRWFSKLLDPAHRLITYSAHSLFSSLFRKRLPPPSPETEQEVRNNQQEEAAFVANNSSAMQQEPVGESYAPINCSDGVGLTELEELLKQKTFTRSEIDHLTALMHSRTVNTLVREEEKGTEMVPSEPMLPSGQTEYPKAPDQNWIENGLVVTPRVTKSFPIEDAASPAEIAKSYMGSRPSKVSASILGAQTPALREDPTHVNSENFPLKSPIMSIVPRATRHAAAHENGFVAARSRGRSAIYSMARTPCARIYPTHILKGGGRTVKGEPSSSSQSALDHDMLSGSKLGAVKRRSSELDNDIGSVGPVRQICQKSNVSCLPVSRGSLSIARSGMAMEAAQKHSSSIHNPILLDEVKHNHMKLSKENVDDVIPSSSFSPFPTESSKMASKILQQLDKFVSPKEKSSELMILNVHDNSPTKLSPSMLRGQALQSMEVVDLSKLLDSKHGNKLDGQRGILSASAQNQKLNYQREEVENGSLKLVAFSDGSLPLVTTEDATNPRNQVLSSAKSSDYFMIKSVSDPPRKKRAFCMSAHEDCLDLDDDAYPNGAVSFSCVEKEMTSSTIVMKETTSGTEAIAQGNPSALSVIMPPKSSTIDGEAYIRTADESRVGQKVDASNSTTLSILDPTFKPFTEATETSFGFEKPASQNGSIAKPPLFTFGNKVVSSTELTAPGASSKEITKPPKEPVADVPLVDLGSNKFFKKIPPMPFSTSSSVGGESAFLKFGASSDPKPGSSISSTTVVGATDSMPKVRESGNGNTETDMGTGSSVRASELTISSAASTSLLTSSKNIFTFGHNSNQSNGSLLSSPSFSSFPPLVTNNQNMFSSSSATTNAIGDSTGSGMATITPATIASTNSGSSTPMVASSSTTSIFKFGSSPVPVTGLPVSSSGSEPLETSKQDTGIGSLNSNAVGRTSAGSGIFCFNSSTMTTVNSQSQSSVIGSSSSSVLGAQASSVASGFATSTQTQSVLFGSSTSSASFGLTGNTLFSSSSLSLPSFSPAESATFSSGGSLLPSSSPASNAFRSGTTFGLGTSASSSEVNLVSSNSGASSTLFGSSWLTSKSPFASGFSFGTSADCVSSASPPTMLLSTSNTSTPQFPFTSAAASTSTQPAFGSPNLVFAAPVNNDQMSMDSMAEDTVQATPPATPIFDQQPAPVQSKFVFGSSTPSGASLFQFGSQQNISPQNPSPFQASGSLGGSFSLGTGGGGGDKSARKIVKVKHRQRKK